MSSWQTVKRIFDSWDLKENEQLDTADVLEAMYEAYITGLGDGYRDSGRYEEYLDYFNK